MKRNDIDRRTVLQSLAVGTTGVATSTRGVNATETKETQQYDSTDREPVSDEEARQLREYYYDLPVSEQRAIFDKHAKELLRMFSSPVSYNTLLSELVDDRYVESDWEILKEPSVSEFPFRNGFSSMGWGKWDGTLAASLRTHKWLKDFELTLVVQPEIDRAYMTVDHQIDPDTGSKHFVVEEQGNTIVSASSCYTSDAQKPDSVHLEGCASEPGCFFSDIYCCPDTDSCYWGNTGSLKSGDTCCQNCRYHCFDGSCY